MTFQKNILDLVNEFPEKIACRLHVTKQTTQISAELKPYITGESLRGIWTLSTQLCGGPGQLVEGRRFPVGSCRLGMSLPGELGGDSSWKKERFGGIYLVYTGFLLPMLKIYFPHILKGTWRHRCSMHTKNLCSASTELMPFAINGHLNYPWFPPAWTVYLLC